MELESPMKNNTVLIISTRPVDGLPGWQVWLVIALDLLYQSGRQMDTNLPVN
jgi:hypothetical protein